MEVKTKKGIPEAMPFLFFVFDQKSNQKQFLYGLVTESVTC
jgi:hypothetical protein